MNLELRIDLSGKYLIIIQVPATFLIEFQFNEHDTLSNMHLYSQMTGTIIMHN